MASVTLNPGTGGANIATNAITRDTITEQMELINVADPITGVCATVDSNGQHVNVNGALPAGGNNIGSVNVANTPNVTVANSPTVSISGTPQVSQDGCLYFNVTDASAHTVTASFLLGFQNLNGSAAQSIAITAYDGATTSGTQVSANEVLGAGQILTYPIGGIKMSTGKITFQCAAIPSGSGIQVLYHT